MGHLQLITIVFVFLALGSLLVYGDPAKATDLFTSQCGFIESPIVVPGPLPPNPPPYPPAQSPSRSPPPPSPPPPRPPGSSCTTTADTQCGAIIPSFTYRPGTSLVGGEIFLSTNGSAASSCAWGCLQMAGCVAFSKNKLSGACSFKDSSAVSNLNGGFETWELCGNPVYGPAATKRTAITSGKQFRRRLLQNNQAPSPQFWSNPNTWPGGVVPGVGSGTGAHATIPCNTVVILDVANLTLGLLRIQGLLKFLDDPSLPLINVKANHVLVEGQLFIGTAAQPFLQKAVIELTPSPGRASLKYTYAPPADPVYPRDLGHKAFVVVGGQVRLYGLPGPSNMPVWVRLSKDANDDDLTIQVDADVKGMWPIGGQIVVTSSDYERSQAESFKIVDVTSTGSGQSIIKLNQPLQFKHYGTINGLSDGFGGFVDERSEVMLLSRNIVITGTDEPAPYHLDGGHFMIFMTNYPPQYIEGVEFYKMGQQGILGRYSIHFHILGAVPQTVCRKNSIHQSKQRCIVNHASHNITLDSNVAYNTSGHCFMLEEGGEENNTFINNIGALTNSVTVRISSDESDDRSSTFWITNLRNSYIGNVAAGASDAGFWFELRSSVRGNSLSIPSISSTVPIQGTIRLFINNTAHSNGGVGLRTYPNGMRPRVGWNVYGVTNVLDGIRSYKNVYTGMFVHNTDSLHITNSLFADNGWGLHFNRNNRINVSNSIFTGLTTNYGNPNNCWDANYANCRPADPKTCKMPLKWGVPGRSSGYRSRTTPTFGIVADQGSFGDYFPYSLKNIKFSNYDATCNMFSGLVMIGTSNYWNAGYNVEGLKFTNNSQPVWAVPRIAQLSPWGGPTDNGEQAQFHMMYDKDGSFNGGKKGYLVANNTDILPPGNAGCTPRSTWNAYTCAGACYRSVLVTYPEPGFVTSSANMYNTRDKFSHLKVTRVADGKVLLLDGNLQEQTPSATKRNYVMNLLGNQIYTVEIMPSTATPEFLPVNVTIQIMDVGECGQGLSLQFKQVEKQPWVITPSSTTFYKLCPGVEPFDSGYSNAQISQACNAGASWLEVNFSPGFNNIPVSAYMSFPQVVLYRTSGDHDGTCQPASNCSSIWSGTSWLYDASGMERRPAFYNPILSVPSDWKNATAPLGNVVWSSWIATQIPSPNSTFLRTYYYRKTFSLTNVNCYSALNLDIVVHDGTIVYLNNVEILRSNLLPDYVDNRTNALNPKNWVNWEYYSLPLNSTAPFFLVDGVNTIAVEEHMSLWGGTVAFDMRISLVQLTSSCSTSQAPKAEICDGLDNNRDGKIDNSLSGALLTKPCSTACGSGLMTCTNGYFQKCSAIVPTVEICDGKDNNCDGLIDNGNEQLNCLAGNVCFKGKCTPVQNATTPVQVWPRNSAGWYFNDTGLNLDALVPTWRTGNTTTRWFQGTAPLGFDFRDPTPAYQYISTRINAFAANQKSLTAYFSKSFNLTQAEKDATFHMDFSVRRVDGIIVYLNGVELWRDNIKNGNIFFNNGSEWMPDGESSEMAFWNCRNCRRNNSALLKAGTNFITAELHIQGSWRRSSAFDLDLIRNAIVPCPLTALNCVRQVEQPILDGASVWKYIDGSLPPPPMVSWMTTGYNDSAWLSGTAPLGFNYGSLNTVVNNGSVGGSEVTRALYFRKWVNLTEAPCYVSLSTNVWGKDGFALYINGAEAVRTNLPDILNSTTYANGSYWTWMPKPYNLTGGWLKAGMNLFAAEVHRVSWSNNIAFDLRISGLREAVTCGPDPSIVSIPWTRGGVRTTSSVKQINSRS